MELGLRLAEARNAESLSAPERVAGGHSSQRNGEAVRLQRGEGSVGDVDGDKADAPVASEAPAIGVEARDSLRSTTVRPERIATLRSKMMSTVQA